MATDLVGLAGEVRVGLDTAGSIASFLEAVLIAAGLALVHVPGIAINRAAQGHAGGERKSDPRDARVIADLVRTRADLRPIVNRRWNGTPHRRAKGGLSQSRCSLGVDSY